MVDAAFLDTGVAIGYCFYFDGHSIPSRRYVEEKIKNGSLDGYWSTLVEHEFDNLKSDKVRQIGDELAKHRRRVQQSTVNRIAPLTVQTILDLHAESGWEIYNTLERWYENELKLPLEKDELVDKIRQFEREVEARHKQKKKDLLSFTEFADRDAAYTAVEVELSGLDQNDRHICLDAHHVAVTHELELEFATTNPRDFVRNGREYLITTETNISNIRNLS